AEALANDSSGGANNATGANALQANTTGAINTADGQNALGSNTAGSGNTAIGDQALGDNNGSENTGTGAGALVHNTTGSSNIAIGAGAGNNLTTGDNNIDIFDPGVTAESNTIRIGTQGTQTGTFIAGIFGTAKIRKACEVVVEKTGQLGCVKSSARYKRDIHDMGDASDKLMKLRPVTFTYKADTSGIQQYGLIAEEVEKVYPELVIDDADGRAETVAYQVLPAMLLNEVQKQARAEQRIARQLAQKDAQIAALQKQVDTLRKKDDQIDAMARRINALEQQARTTAPDHLASAMR
ncbi:MAG: tail fiber domain-containing protein, partial [Candidatus Binataceae bacterium]